MSRWYAVHRGHHTGVFSDWNTVVKEITGFSNPVYRVCTSEADAVWFAKYGPVERQQDPIQVTDTSPWGKSLVPDIYARCDIDWSPIDKILSVTMTGQSKPHILQVPGSVQTLTSALIVCYAIVRVIETYEAQISRGPLSRSMGQERLDILLPDTHAYNIVTRYLPKWKSQQWKDSYHRPITQGLAVLQALDRLLVPLQEQHIVHFQLRKPIRTSQSSVIVH
jgi:hypothetical protein